MVVPGWFVVKLLAKAKPSTTTVVEAAFVTPLTAPVITGLGLLPSAIKPYVPKSVVQLLRFSCPPLSAFAW
jgi:hypothetical protein